MTDDLTKALAEMRRVTPPNSPWEAGDIGVGSSPVDYHIATILNAALSGDLIPRADADLAVALMVEPLLKLREGIEADIRSAHHGRGNGSSSAMREDDRDFRAAVAAAFDALAPAPASALAELQALRDARTALTGDRATDFDNDAVYQFSKLMKDKMAKSRAKGRKGWNDPTQCSPDFLRHLLYEHIYKGDPVDVANLCMMLRHYDEPTTPKPEDDLRLLHTEAAEAIRALAPASALAELQALRDERDVAIDSATQQDALRKATLATMRSISAENEDLRTELATLRAQVERLRAAAEPLGAWLSAALDDPKPCAEMKRDINAWFAALTEGAAP